MKTLNGWSLLALAMSSCAVLTSAWAQCEPAWQPGDGLIGVDGGVLSATTWDPDGPGPQIGKIVLGGEFLLAGTARVQNVATFDGTQFGALGAGLEGGYVQVVHASATGSLYAAGFFTSSGGEPISCVARWTGSQWQSVGNIAGFANSLTTNASGEVFVGGNLELNGGPRTICVARWDGSTWIQVGDLGGAPISSLAVSTSGVLYRGSDNTGGYDPLQRFQNGSWQSVGPLLNGRVTGLLAVPDGRILLWGSFSRVGSEPAYNNLAYFDGTTYSRLFTGVFGTRTATRLANGDIVAGGAFTQIGVNTVLRVARFNGSTWSPMGDGLGTSQQGASGGLVTALAELPDGRVLAFGGLRSTGTLPLGNAAVWDGSSWQQPTPGFSDRISDFAILTNGDVVVTGDFRSVNGVQVPGIAQRVNGVWQAVPGVSPQSPMEVTRNVAALPTGGFAIMTSGQPGASTIVKFEGGQTTTYALTQPNERWATVVATPGGDLIALGQIPQLGDPIPSPVRLYRLDAPGVYTQLGNLAIEFISSVDQGDLVATSDGRIIIGRAFTGSAGGPSVNVGWAEFSGGVWTIVPRQLPTDPGYSSFAETTTGQLIAVRSISTAGGPGILNEVVRFDGPDITVLGSFRGGFNVVGRLSTLVNGDIIAAGSFTTLNDEPIRGLARFDGNTWTQIPVDADPTTTQAITFGKVLPLSSGGFAVINGQLGPSGVVSPYLSFYAAPAGCSRPCDDVDFNNNGIFPEDADVTDFVSVLAGSTCWQCSDTDFNNNGVFPEDQDVVDFFHVLAGGGCP
ncbi:MAG TPA: hypothetical protein VK157_05335 [Phycisphaerales bacterium]|nr:hypothetical protein [Phycisphaerales bacterium]